MKHFMQSMQGYTLLNKKIFTLYILGIMPRTIELSPTIQRLNKN